MTAVVQVFGHRIPIQAFNDHDRLIAERPWDYSRGQAEQEAHYLWMEYVKAWFPDEYAKIPKGRSFIPFSNDKLTRVFPPVTDGGWYWPIVEFNCVAEDDEDEGEDEDEDEDENEDEEFEDFMSSGQHSDLLADSGSDHSSNGSQ